MAGNWVESTNDSRERTLVAMKFRRLVLGMIVTSSLANVGCVMFDGADNFPQPCYGPDCQGGSLLMRGNTKYGHNGAYLGEPVFTPTAPVIPGGSPIPPGVTEIQEAPEPVTIKKPKDDAADDMKAAVPTAPSAVPVAPAPTPPVPTPPRPGF